MLRMLKFLTLIVLLLPLAGCENVSQALQELDYGCVDVELDGYFTDSRGTGRAVRLPDGETLTVETIEALCPGAS